MRPQAFLWLTVLGLLLRVSPASGQTSYQIRLNSSPAAGSNLLLEVTLADTDPTGANATLASANIVFQLTGGSACLNLAGATVVQQGTWSPQPTAGNYANVTVAQVGLEQLSVNVLNSRVAVSDIPAAQRSLYEITTTPKQVAIIRIPTLGCGCSITPTLAALTNLNQLPATPGPIVEILGDGTTPLVASPSPISLVTPAAPTGPTAVTACAGPVTNVYTAASPTQWRLGSTIGSAIVAVNGTPVTPTQVVITPASSITITSGVPSGNQVDTLFTGPGATVRNACANQLLIDVTAAPLTSFGLSTVGPPNVCTGDDVVLRISGSQVGFDYQIIDVDGNPVGPSLAGTGGPLNFNLGPQPLNDTTGYFFRYRVTDGGLCTSEQPLPGLNVLVVVCSISNTIASATPASVCAGDVLTLEGVPDPVTAATSSRFWTVNTTPFTPGAVSFPTGTTGDTLRVVFNPVTTNVTVEFTYVEQVISAGTLVAGTATRVTQLLQSPSPVITGPLFLLDDVAAPDTAVFTLTGGAVAGHIYSWQVSPPDPTVTVTAGGATATLEFSPANPSPFLYTVSLTDSIVGGCTSTVTRSFLFSECDAQVGVAGPLTPDPLSNICRGESAVVFTSLLSADSSRWEFGPAGSGTFTPVPTSGTFGAENSPVLLVPALTASTDFRLVATGTGSCQNISNVVTINVFDEATAGQVVPADTSVCENGIITFREIGGSGTSVVWEQSNTGIDGSWQQAFGNTVAPDSFRTNPLTGPTFFRAIYITGCDTAASNSVLVTVAPDPVGTITTAPAAGTIFCTGDTIALETSVNSPLASGLWVTSGAGGFSPSATDPTADYIINPADGGRTVTLQWITSAGTCPVDVQSIAYDVAAPSVAGSIALNNLNLCLGSTTDSLIVSGTVGTGQWRAINPGTGLVVPGTFEPNDSSARVVFVSTPSTLPGGGNVELQWLVSNQGCPADTARVTVVFSPDVVSGTFTPLASDTVCFGDTLALTATAVGIGRWQGSPFGTFDDPDDPTTVFRPNPTASGQTVPITWTVSSPSAFCLPLVLTQTVYFQPVPVAFILSPTLDTAAVCFTDSLPLAAVGLNGTGVWQATYLDNTPAAGTVSPSANAPSAFYVPDPSDLAQVFVKLVWRVTSSLPGVCTTQAIDSVLIIVSDSARGTFNLGTPPPLCAGASTDPLGATLASTGLSGVWRTPNGLGDFVPDSTSPNARYNSVPGEELIDGGNIILQWIVLSPACGTDTLQDTIEVLPSTVNGNWAGLSSTNQAICFPGTTDPLNATVGLPSTGVWVTTLGGGTFVDGGGLPAPTLPTARYLPAAADRGQRIDLTWLVQTGGCADRFDTDSVFVYDSVSIRFPQPQDICFPNASDTLRGEILGDSAAVGVWSAFNVTDGNPALGSFTPSNQDPNARYIPSGVDLGDSLNLTWRVEIPGNNDLCGVDSIVRGVRVSDPNAISFVRINRSRGFTVETDSTVCFGDTLLIRFAGGTDYIWDSDTSIFRGGGTTDSVVVAPSFSTTYRVRVITGNCVTTFLIPVIIQPGIPPISVNPPTAGPICVGESVQLEVENELESGPEIFYQWTDILGGPALGINPADVNNEVVIATPPSTTTYRVLARTTGANSCLDDAFVTVTVTPNIPPVLANVRLCQGVPFQTTDLVPLNLAAIQASLTDSIWYRGTPAQVIAANGLPPYDIGVDSLLVIQQSTSLPVPIDTPGTFNYSLYVEQGACNSLVPVTVEVIPLPRAEFTESDTEVSFFERTIRFEGQPNDPDSLIYQYVWDFGDTLSGTLNTDSSRVTSHVYTSSGIFTVLLFITDPDNCTDFEVKTNLVSIAEEEYYFPTAFTPNSDSINELFRALPDSFPDPEEPTAFLPRVVSFQIFDRWNNLIWMANDNRGWNGQTAGGEPFDTGVYLYKVVINQRNRGNVAYTGIIHLLR